jgi:hypothetical protein
MIGGAETEKVFQSLRKVHATKKRFVQSSSGGLLEQEEAEKLELENKSSCLFPAFSRLSFAGCERLFIELMASAIKINKGSLVSIVSPTDSVHLLGGLLSARFRFAFVFAAAAFAHLLDFILLKLQKVSSSFARSLLLILFFQFVRITHRIRQNEI